MEKVECGLGMPAAAASDGQGQLTVTGFRGKRGAWMLSLSVLGGVVASAFAPWGKPDASAADVVRPAATEPADNGRAFLPAYPNPTPYLDGAYHKCLPAADLLGFDLRFGGSELIRPEPEFCVGIPTEMTLYWVPRAADWTGRTLRVRMKGGGPTFEQEFPIATGAWRMGSVCKQTVSVEVPRFTHVGEGALSIGLSCSDVDSGGWSTLYVGPSLTNQIVTTSRFSDEALADALGKDVARLKASFRLGPGARIQVPVREEPGRVCIGLAVVSALHHGTDFEQGAPVLSIQVDSAEPGAMGMVYVRAGLHTSLSEYDVPRPGTFSLERAETVAERAHPGERLTWDMKPLRLYTYLGRLSFERPVHPQGLEIRYLLDRGVIDVYELVLLFDESALEPRGEGGPR